MPGRLFPNLIPLPQDVHWRKAKSGALGEKNKNKKQVGWEEKRNKHSMHWANKEVHDSAKHTKHQNT